ncbi:MAG: 5,6-dimethylbenzimidazole synthase, partial [Nitrospirales bacterium]
PRPVKVLAYLCLGYVSEFAAQPDLEAAGWRARIPVEQLIHHESWGNKTVFAVDDQLNGKG